MSDVNRLSFSSFFIGFLPSVFLSLITENSTCSGKRISRPIMLNRTVVHFCAK